MLTHTQHEHPSDLRDKPTRDGHDQHWKHEPGNEYLAANPIDIPGLEKLLHDMNPMKSTTIFGPPYQAHNNAVISQKHNPSSDQLSKLPTEIVYHLLSYLGSKDIANLRLTSPHFRPLPANIFRMLLFEDLPWIWEVEDFPITEVDWHALYLVMKAASEELKGLKNRKRVWGFVSRACERIEHFTGEGKDKH